MRDREDRIRRREAALIQAVHTLLDDRPWPAITVADLAETAGLSRTAFYEHFKDRQELLITILGVIGLDLAQVGDEWMSGGVEPAVEHEHGLKALTDIFVRHGRVLQAVSDAATHDPQVGVAWDQLTAGIIALTTAGIIRDVAAGHSHISDPEQMATALTAMTREYLLMSFGRRPFTDPVVVAATLTTIWTRALYNAHPPG